MCEDGKSRDHVWCHMKAATRSYKCPVCNGEGGNRTHARRHMKLARTQRAISVCADSWKVSGKDSMAEFLPIQRLCGQVVVQGAMAQRQRV